MAVICGAFAPVQFINSGSNKAAAAAAPSRRTNSVWCSADSGGAPAPLKLLVNGATELLRFLSPKRRPTTTPNDEKEEVTIVRSVDDVFDIVSSDYERAYFLTGNVTMDIYAEDCLFEDPTINFKGKYQYLKNLELLVPFFDSPSLTLERIEKGSSCDKNFFLAYWILRTYLKLPWRPLISIKGSTVYDLDEEFKIVRHAESWNISALEALGQIFALKPDKTGSL